MARLPTLLAYALADLWGNRAATLATILLFAVVAGPPFLLYAAKTGVVAAWTADLARDVGNREVVVSRGRADDRWLTTAEIGEIQSWPETGFLTPEPSFSVRTHEWAPLDSDAFRPSRASFVLLDLRTTRPGDPVFGGAPIPQGFEEVAFSTTAAAQLGIDAGGRAVLKVERTQQGRVQREYLELLAVAVLEEWRWPRRDAFVSPELAHAIRAYQFGEVERSTFPAAVEPATASWPTLRIYAPSIHEASALRDRLRANGFSETRLRSDQIEQLKRVESGIDRTFALILGLAVAGFAASLFLSEWIAAERKAGDLALLMAVGHTTSEVAAMRAAQAAVTIGAGLATAMLAVAAATPLLHGLARDLLGIAQAPPTPWGRLASALLPALLVGAAAAVYATRRARRTDLAAALRRD